MKLLFGLSEKRPLAIENFSILKPYYNISFSLSTFSYVFFIFLIKFVIENQTDLINGGVK